VVPRIVHDRAQIASAHAAALLQFARVISKRKTIAFRIHLLG
jgi:hypothetical protein